MGKPALKVLVIQAPAADETSVRPLLSRNKRFDFEILGAGSFAEGMDVLDGSYSREGGRSAVAVAVLDLEMQGDDKWETVREMQRLYPKTGIVALGNENKPGMAIKAFKNGASDFLAKEKLRSGIFVESVVCAARRAGGHRISPVEEQEKLRKVKFEWILQGQLARGRGPHPEPPEMIRESVDVWIGEAGRFGVNSILCLLESNEMRVLYDGIPGGLLSYYKSHGFAVGHVSVPDFSWPPLKPWHLRRTWRLYQELPKPVLVHCRFGVARSGHAIHHINQNLLYGAVML